MFRVWAQRSTPSSEQGLFPRAPSRAVPREGGPGAGPDREQRERSRLAGLWPSGVPPHPEQN